MRVIRKFVQDRLAAELVQSVRGFPGLRNGYVWVVSIVKGVHRDVEHILN